MLNFFEKFHNDEDGAVTVDFVVLTAAIVVLGFIVIGFVADGAQDLASQIEAELDVQTTELTGQAQSAIDARD